MTESSKPPTAKAVTLHLPPDILVAIARLSRDLGQPQSEVLISALRHGLERYATLPTQSLDLTELSDRLTALETLPAQVAELTAQVDRLLRTAAPETAPPELPESPELQDEIDPFATECPRCSHALSAPLKSSGRQVCIKCGWTNKPRPPRLNAPSDLPPDELKRLLDQAAADAIANMKPKKQPAPNPSKFPFGRL